MRYRSPNSKSPPPFCRMSTDNLLRPDAADESKKAGCTSREAIVTAKAAVDRSRLGKVLIPERLVWLPAKEWRYSERVSPGRSIAEMPRDSTHTEPGLLPGVVL